MCQSTGTCGVTGNRRQYGFTYLGAMFLVAVIGAALAGTTTVWHMAVQREKEKELLFIGHQFRQAIGRYHAASPGQQKKYPSSLEILLKDTRQPAMRRHLRKLYRDPMTGKAEWGVILGDRGEIVGVHSLSDEQPVKVSGFSEDDSDFEGAKKYSDWIFSYREPPSSATVGTVLPSGSMQGTKAE